MRALPGHAATEQQQRDQTRRALLRDYFQAAIREHSLDRVIETFGRDLQAIGADLGLLAYGRALYDGAAKAFDLGKRIFGKGKG